MKTLIAPGGPIKHALCNLMIKTRRHFIGRPTARFLAGPGRLGWRSSLNGEIKVNMLEHVLDWPLCGEGRGSGLGMGSGGK